MVQLCFFSQPYSSVWSSMSVTLMVILCLCSLWTFWQKHGLIIACKLLFAKACFSVLTDSYLSCFPIWFWQTTRTSASSWTGCWACRQTFRTLSLSTSTAPCLPSSWTPSDAAAGTWAFWVRTVDLPGTPSVGGCQFLWVCSSKAHFCSFHLH